MTDQEVFDKVVTALRKQGRRSSMMQPHPEYGSQEICRYRGPRGVKCAAGHLIPDELYDEEMEGKDWNSIVENWPSIAALNLPTDLVSEFQYIHDHHSIGDWETFWGVLAEKYSLAYTPCSRQIRSIIRY